MDRGLPDRGEAGRRAALGTDPSPGGAGQDGGGRVAPEGLPRVPGPPPRPAVQMVVRGGHPAGRHDPGTPRQGNLRPRVRGGRPLPVVGLPSSTPRQPRGAPHHLLRRRRLDHRPHRIRRPRGRLEILTHHPARHRPPRGWI